jgi:hypothetical protein
MLKIHSIMSNIISKYRFSAIAALLFVAFNSLSAANFPPSVCELIRSFAPNRTVVLAEGEPIYLELTSDAALDELEVGNQLNFRVTSNVLIDSKEAVRAFTPAIGTINRIEYPTTNTDGRIQVTVRHVRAVDGQQVLVEGPTNWISLKIGAQTTVYVKNEIRVEVRN